VKHWDAAARNISRGASTSPSRAPRGRTKLPHGPYDAGLAQRSSRGYAECPVLEDNALAGTQPTCVQSGGSARASLELDESQ